MKFQKITLVFLLQIFLWQSVQAQDFKKFISLFELVNQSKIWTAKDIQNWIQTAQEAPNDLKSFFPNANLSRKYYPLARFESGNMVVVLFSDFDNEGYNSQNQQQIYIHTVNFDKTGRQGISDSYIFGAGGDGGMYEKYDGKMETDGKTFLRIIQESSKMEKPKKIQYKISKKGLSFEKNLED